MLVIFILFFFIYFYLFTRCWPSLFIYRFIYLFYLSVLRPVRDLTVTFSQFPLKNLTRPLNCQVGHAMTTCQRLSSSGNGMALLWPLQHNYFLLGSIYRFTFFYHTHPYTPTHTYAYIYIYTNFLLKGHFSANMIQEGAKTKKNKKKLKLL